MTILYTRNISDSRYSQPSTRKNMIDLAQESRILPTKLAHPCESDTPIKMIEPPTVGSEREMQPYKDRAFQAHVPHQDSKGIGVTRRTTALVCMHTEAWEGEEQAGGGKLFAICSS